MNILIFEWKNFGIEDVREALENLGHSSKCVSSELMRERVSLEFDQLFEQEFSSAAYDCVFTFNYSPVISNNCNKRNIPYIAYVYDSPLIALYSYTIINPCNYVFLFDKALYLDFKKENINTVYYMPLSANTARLERMFSMPLSEDARQKYTGDISFVGSMYNEAHNLFDRMANLTPFTRGYLDAVMDAQMKVYGYYFVE